MEENEFMKDVKLYVPLNEMFEIKYRTDEISKLFEKMEIKISEEVENQV